MIVGLDREQALSALETRLGHKFHDRRLLDRALTHTSFAHEDVSGGTRHSEPLEFLGDSVLGFLVADFLHRRDPEGDEGTKSRARAALVSAASLATHAARLGLPNLLRLGRGEEKSGGRGKKALWSDAFEALVAVLYLDGGIEVARRFVAAEFGSRLAQAGIEGPRDHKSRLQELLQGRGHPPPDYVVEVEGPSHRPQFRVRCLIRDGPTTVGEGSSKKEAQQEAARRALELLEP